ncbi:hypothetical protein, partial [Thiohalocapsa halophila]
PALAAAHAAGLGVVIKEGLANGRLTSRNRDPDFSATRRMLADLAQERNVGIDSMALAGALAQPWADVVLSGAATTAQLRSNLRAAALDWDERAADMAEALAETPDAYWHTRSTLAWN